MDIDNRKKCFQLFYKTWRLKKTIKQDLKKNKKTKKTKIDTFQLHQELSLL